jgi:membrane peptidoglycan carboxypeptidase
MPSALRARNVLGLLVAFVITSMAGGVLAAGLAMPAIGASGVLTKNSVTFFDSLPSELTQPPLAESSVLLASDGSRITTFFEENRVNKDLKDISQNMQAAIVAIEDARFFQHGGVDPKGLARAAIVNKITGHTAQGASTLTQQYVKNVLVETANAKGDKVAQAEATEKDASRKVKEIRYAVALEKQLPKLEILNRYLNIAWFGGKINGVESASKYYFSTTAKKLTLPQAATLAGMVQNPVKYSPRYNPKTSLQRRNLVLAKMLEQGKIDQKAHDAAVKAKLGAKITFTNNGCANAGKNGYYCEYVRRQIIDNKAFSALGKTPEERENTLKRGGLKITTAMSPKIMKAAWKGLTSTIPTKDRSRVATATVTVEPGTGLVRSIQQNKLYDPAENKRKKITGKAAINYSVDQEWGGGNGFQTGSTFKPFTLATWLKAGKSLNAVVPSSSGVAPFSQFRSCNPEFDRHQTYTYFNAGDGQPNGDSMSVWNGTAKSVNGVYVSMEKQLNLCDIRKTAESLGVHLAAPRDDFCTRKKSDRTERLPNCVPSLTLGVADLSPMTLAAAYATFAAKGTYCAPIAITSIKDRDGKSLSIPKRTCRRALDEGVANTVNLGLSKVLTPVGTAASVGPLPNGRPASGKTGTTNNSVDTWFAGYTPQLATAVWVGDPEPHRVRNHYERTTLNYRTINGRKQGPVYGATFAGVIWKKIMVQAVKGMEIKHFAGADSRLLVSPKRTVPDVRGKSVDAATAILKEAGFLVTVSNDPVKSKYPVGSVASTSPEGGSEVSYGSSITLTLSAGGGGDDDGGDKGNDKGDGNPFKPGHH